MTQNDRNIVAPEQRVKSLADHLQEIGFTHYAESGASTVYSFPIGTTLNRFLFLFADRWGFRMYKGVKTGLTIRASKLFTCRTNDLNENLAQLSEQNYL
jgi:hypothetical protein